MDSIYSYVMDRLEASKGNWHKIARETGVSERTIEKWARKTIKNPGVKNFEIVANYFKAREIKPR